MTTKFEMEKGRVVLLMRRLGIDPDAYEDPNAGSTQESGADVVAVVAGRRIGIQVTDIDTGERRGHARANEKRRATEAAARGTTYGTWAQNDVTIITSRITETIVRKTRMSFAGFDEFWLLICAGIPEFGATVSTFVMTPYLDPAALDAASLQSLAASKYTRAFVYAVLGVEEKALYTWKPGGQWSKSVRELPAAERGPDLWALRDDPELLADPDAWCAREVERVLAELRGSST